MRNILVLVPVLIFPTICFAGFETVLVEEQQGNCTIRVVHDAVPSFENGPILFRSFEVIDGVHYPCAPTRFQVTSILGKAIAKYISHENLKPATSIMVGKISSFPWVKSDWQTKGQSGTYEKMSITEFNALVSSKAISQPFEIALNINGLEFDGASCEKIQFYENGYPMDALCWFKIKST
jgi:hypothetical protein